MTAEDAAPDLEAHLAWAEDMLAVGDRPLAPQAEHDATLAERMADWLDRDDVAENRAAEQVRARAAEVNALGNNDATVMRAALDAVLAECDYAEAGARCVVNDVVMIDVGLIRNALNGVSDQ